jgi:hypothetical protein
MGAEPADRNALAGGGRVFMGILLKVLRLVGVLAAALVLGLTLTHVLQAPGSRGLDGATWLQVQHTFYGGFAVVGGTAEIAGLIGQPHFVRWVA